MQRKIAVFIPVRLASTRLPGKALLDLVGQPVIVHLVERLQLARIPDEIVICTTEEATDDPLIRIAEDCGIRLVRGSKDDLLERYHQAALESEVDFIVNVDGDDILVDPEQVDQVAELLLESSADFVKCEGLPFGGAPVGISADALFKICGSKKESDTATGWSNFFTDPAKFKQRTLIINDEALCHPEIRMTLDYKEDFEFFKAIFAELYSPGRPVRLREAITLILSRPDIREINSGLDQTYWAHFNSQLPASLR